MVNSQWLLVAARCIFAVIQTLAQLYMDALLVSIGQARQQMSCSDVQLKANLTHA